MWIIAPLLCGLIFGAGLLISGMMQPTKVLAFWTSSARGSEPCRGDGCGAAVSVPGFRLADARRSRGLPAYFRPGKSRSICRWSRAPRCSESGGALSGYVPGPALESLATLSPGVIVFVVQWARMVLTTLAQSRLTAQRERCLARDGRLRPRPRCKPG
jgi:hypothetical protein